MILAPIRTYAVSVCGYSPVLYSARSPAKARWRAFQDYGIVSDCSFAEFLHRGCAVGVLANCWKHGEELRRWHNLKTQIRGEGERANENGGVLNPALLSIGDAAA